MLDIRLPSLNRHNIQRWFEATDITFNVYDYCVGGIVPHTELLGTTVMGLTSAVKASGSTVLLSLQSPYLQKPGTKEIELQVDLRVPADLHELPYGFDGPDDVWLNNYKQKLEMDLMRGLGNINFRSDGGNVTSNNSRSTMETIETGSNSEVKFCSAS